jgi:hypothetical protein
MSDKRRQARGVPSYRVVAYELSGGRETVLMDATGAGSVACVGTTRNGRMRGELGHGGPIALREQIALLIADNPTGRSDQAPREPPAPDPEEKGANSIRRGLRRAGRRPRMLAVCSQRRRRRHTARSAPRRPASLRTTGS